MSDSMPRVFTTLLDNPIVVSPVKAVYSRAVVTNKDLVAFGDARRVQVSEMLFGNTYQAADVVAGRAVPRLATVVPAPGATVEKLEYDGHVAYDSSRGWKITGAAPFKTLLGPQGAELVAMTRFAAEHLHGDAGESPHANQYYGAVDGNTWGLEELVQYALDALQKHGADRWWWEHAWGEPCWELYGHEMVAVGARDLLDTAPGWTAEAYDALTAPWRAAFTGIPGAPEVKTSAALAGDTAAG
ncbi:hypothetical protein [Actinomadura violacea]|uniref:Uncharacterized protein n=1 Tax=Actinomadura violacea TaxID=2819934 RepID=A0ABS3RYD9_9ACTN|nr:hypothetical protein [Actinomadura violacea]MBO2461717.1 hypothetical protein [Actinomadura violacea]